MVNKHNSGKGHELDLHCREKNTNCIWERNDLDLFLLLSAWILDFVIWVFSLHFSSFFHLSYFATVSLFWIFLGWHHPINRTKLTRNVKNRNPNNPIWISGTIGFEVFHLWVALDLRFGPKLEPTLCPLDGALGALILF